VRYAAKIGLVYRKNNFSAGVTITTPSISLFGEGTIAVDILGTNILYKGSSTTILANDRLEKLKANYKSPLSITGGINWGIKKSSFGISFQYYSSIAMGDFSRAAPSAFVRPASLHVSLGSDEFLRLKDAAKSVFNISIGHEFALNPTMTLNFSCRTNNSYYDEALNKSVGIKSEITIWDIYHFTAGTTITRGRSKVSVALLLSTGNDDERKHYSSFTNPDEIDFLQGSTIITNATYSSI
jgi:hypothetical protein